MTTSTSPQDPAPQDPAPQDPSPQDPGRQDPAPDSPGRALRLHDPGELLAAIPALLGFVPADSLVIVCLGGARENCVEMVVRHDLVALVAEPDRMVALAAQLQALFEETGVGGVTLALLDRDWACGEARAWHRELVGELGALLLAGGARVRGAVLAREIAGGAPWASMLDARSGAIPDPRESAVAAAHVYQGRMIRDSRAELAESIAPASAAESAEMGRLVDAARDRTRVRRELGGRSALRMELELVLVAVAFVDSGEMPEAGELAQLGVAISRPEVRDALLALVSGDQAPAAERLWAMLARVLPGPERAEAAALCATSAYARGDGPFSGICVDAALEANPRHRLALLLREALDRGLHPDRIRSLAEVGHGCAASLGVFLPAP